MEKLIIKKPRKYNQMNSLIKYLIDNDCKVDVSSTAKMFGTTRQTVYNKIERIKNNEDMYKARKKSNQNRQLNNLKDLIINKINAGAKLPAIYRFLVDTN